MKLTVDLGKNSYPIYIENNILDSAGEYISQVFSGKKIMIVSDDNVYPLFGGRLTKSLCGDYECFHLVLPHGEATKSFQSLPEIYSALLRAKLSRSDAIIALGGGVIGDLAGFAAASYLRGISLSRFPLPCSHRWIPLSAEKLQLTFLREKILSAHSISLPLC